MPKEVKANTSIDDPPTPQEQAFFEQVRIRIARYSVGFVNIESPADLEAERAIGSGTFVRVGETHGILTAAHVLQPLIKRGRTGLLRFDRPGSIQVHEIAIQKDHAILIGPGPSEDSGPDLGFIILSPEIASSVAAASDFYDLNTFKSAILARLRPTEDGFYAIAGVIAERTRISRNMERRRTDVFFEASVEVGDFISVPKDSPYDYLMFSPHYAGEKPAPSSFEGVSGGASWKAFARQEQDGQFSVAALWLYGIAFAQSESISGRRTVKCHGPESIYVELRSKLPAT